MAFPRNLLNENEELVLDLRPHWIRLVIPSAAFGAAVIVGLLVTVGWNPSGGLGGVLKILVGIAVLVALAWLVWSWLVWNNTMFVLTSDRIVTRNGVLSKSGTEIPLERINTVFFREGVLERMVGSGDLAIESAGERGTETLNAIRKPSVVQKEIYVQMEQNENRKFDRIRPGAPVSADPTAVGDSIPAQIEKLAELHQRGVLSDSEYQTKKADLLDRM